MSQVLTAGRADKPRGGSGTLPGGAGCTAGPGQHRLAGGWGQAGAGGRSQEAGGLDAEVHSLHRGARGSV